MKRDIVITLGVVEDDVGGAFSAAWADDKSLAYGSPRECAGKVINAN